MHGEWPAAKNAAPAETLLGRWFEKVRHAHRKGKHSDERIAMLESSPHYTCPMTLSAAKAEYFAMTKDVRAECKALQLQLIQLGVKSIPLWGGTLRKWRSVRADLEAQLNAIRQSKGDGELNL
jgi:hypothetical protein